MNKKILLAGVLAVALAAQSAGAKTLEEVLKEKGVITEADYNDIMKDKPKTKPFTYKLGQGFTLTSDDEKYQIALSGQMQFRYTFTDKGGDNTSNISDWRIRRAKTNFNGYVFTKDLTFKMNYNWANLNTSSTVVEELFANYRVIDELQFRVGQDKVQYARQWITPSSANQFVETSFVTDAFKPGYDIGLGVNGSALKGLLTYAGQWMGGKGQNTTSSTNDNSYTLRFAVNPLGDMKYSEADLDMSPKPLVSIGSSFYANTLKSTYKAASGTTAASSALDSNNLNYANATTGWFGLFYAKQGALTPSQNFNISSFETDMAFKWQGLSLQAEYFWGQAVGQSAASPSVIAKGFYAQAGYFVLPKTVELAMRYAWMDYNHSVRDSLKSEIQWAASWYVNGHNLKIQSDFTKSYLQNYVDARAKAGSGVNDFIFRTQAQILF